MLEDPVLIENLDAEMPDSLIDLNKEYYLDEMR
jgi:hypothetical protein